MATNPLANGKDIKVPVLVAKIDYRDLHDIADECNELAKQFNKTYDPQLLVGITKKREQFHALRKELREAGVAFGTRHVNGMVDVVSHLTADGKPDTSYPEGKAYWDDVAAAAKAGVPNVVGTQR